MGPLWKRSATSPGKVILFGEHSVVYGRPAVALAIDLLTTVETTAYSREDMTLGGSPDAYDRNPYLKEAARMEGLRGLDITVRSSVPMGSGMGSSAALISAFLTTLSAEPKDAPALARNSFVCEYQAQRTGSPADTSTVTAGGLISIGGRGYGTELWQVPAMHGRGPWRVDRLRDPGWTWIVAFSGVPKSTGPRVHEVGVRLRDDTSHLLDRITAVAEDGIRALERADRAEVGRLMNLNHELLVELGIGHPSLDRMVAAVRGSVLGVKITGAGFGGSLLALTQGGDEERVARLFSDAGGIPFVVGSSPQGTRLLP